MKVVVIGGGPAGMMAAITAAEEHSNEVIILEKMNSCGKKLLITGKGRCNITNNADMDEFIKNTPGNGKFLYGAFHEYTNRDIINFLRRMKVETKVERGGRVFPVSDKSIDVLDAFMTRIRQLNIKIKTNSNVKKINIINNKIESVTLENNEKIFADKVILATGGASYKVTGSTGDGYKLAESIGHTIKPIKPSLVPLEAYDNEFCRDMQGLSLKNVKVKLLDKEKNKIIYEDFGEMIFTHYGVSGPIILSSSAYLLRYKNFEDKLNRKQISLSIDLKPALTEEKLDERLLRDFSKLKNKQFKNSFDKLLPHKMIEPMIEKTKIKPYKKINEITKEERKLIVKLLKNLEIVIRRLRPIDEAIITSGGIDVKEINPKTMESKKVEGLYFAGEIIDVDSLTGGYNLQIAWSTGYLAGR